MSDLEILAFLDESRKPVRDAGTGRVGASGDYYGVAAAIVLRGDVGRMQLRVQPGLDRLGRAVTQSGPAPNNVTQPGVAVATLGLVCHSLDVGLCERPGIAHPPARSAPHARARPLHQTRDVRERGHRRIPGRGHGQRSVCRT